CANDARVYLVSPRPFGTMLAGPLSETGAAIVVFDVATAVAATPRLCGAPLPGQSSTTVSATSPSPLSEPPGHVAVPVDDSGRRNAAIPFATATWVAGQSVVSTFVPVSSVSRTVSVRRLLWKRSVSTPRGSVGSASRTNRSAFPFVSTPGGRRFG